MSSPRYQLSVKSQLKPQALGLQETESLLQSTCFQGPLTAVETVQTNFTSLTQNVKMRTQGGPVRADSRTGCSGGLICLVGSTLKHTFWNLIIPSHLSLFARPLLCWLTRSVRKCPYYFPFLLKYSFIPWPPQVTLQECKTIDHFASKFAYKNSGKGEYYYMEKIGSGLHAFPELSLSSTLNPESF